MLLVILLLFISIRCDKNFDKIVSPEWNPNIAFPFIESVISLHELAVQDTSLIINPDSTLRIFYSLDSLFNISVSEIFEIPDQETYSKSYSIGELDFIDFNLNVSPTLNSLLPYMNEAMRDSLLKYEGAKAVFPPMIIPEPFIIETEPIESFTYVKFSEGTLVFSIFSSFPVEIIFFSMEVLNGPDQVIIDTLEFWNIKPGDSIYDSIDLSGLELDHQFAFRNAGIVSNTSYPDSVLIDLDNGVDLQMSARNLKVINGEAVIKDQLVINQTQLVDFELDSNARIEHIDFNTCMFEYSVVSNIPVSIVAYLQLPSVLQSGVIPEQYIIVNPFQTVNTSWNLNQSSFDLSTDPERPFNRFPVKYQIMILSSQDQVYFDSSNNIVLDFKPVDLDFSFTDGYLGKRTVILPDSVFDLDLEFFNHFDGGLTLTNPRMNIYYSNSFGIPFNLKMDITGISIDWQEQDLNLDTLYIESPQVYGEVVHGQFNISKENSSIVEFIALTPQFIAYYGGGITNPAGIANNFIGSESRIDVSMDIELPLSLQTDHLMYIDTVEVNLNENDVKSIESGVFSFIIENGFPFDINLEFVILDPEFETPVETYSFDQISSAPVDESGKVYKKKISYLEERINNYTFQNLKAANKVILRTKLNTYDSGNVPAVLYTSYTIGISIGIELLAKL